MNSQAEYTKDFTFGTKRQTEIINRKKATSFKKSSGMLNNYASKVNTPLIRININEDEKKENVSTSKNQNSENEDFTSSS